MKAYWKGIEAARRLPTWVSADSRIEAFLNAVGDVVVVGGRVVELEKALPDPFITEIYDDGLPGVRAMSTDEYRAAVAAKAREVAE